MGRTQVADSPVTPIHPDDDLSSFDCGVERLNRWLVERAKANEAKLASRTYVVKQAGRVVGYYAISTASIFHAAVAGGVRRNMPDPIPAILLGQLAVDRSMQGQGLGVSLLQDALLRILHASKVIGTRVVVVDAISDEARAFYLRFGFTATRTDAMRLFLDIRAIEAVLC